MRPVLCKSLHRRALATYFTASIAISSSLSYAQSTLPAGWQLLSASQFAQVAGELFDSNVPSTDEHHQEVIAHAWETFLTNEQFIASSDVNTVLQLLGMFSNQRPEGIDASTVGTMLSRLNSRLGSDPNALSGTDLYDLGNAMKGARLGSEDGDLQKVGEPALRNPRLFVLWMNANQWQALETHHLYNLFGFVNADAIDRRRFSARWTGVLTPPQSGEYIFEQARVYQGKDCKLKLWVDEQLVLDSSNHTEGTEPFTSETIRLAAGQPVNFKAELVHDTSLIQYSASAPMAMVTWKRENSDKTFIPSAAFSPAEGFGAEGSNGLRGEYFADQDLSDLKLTRLDPTLDMIWSWPPTAAIESDAAREVLAVIVDRLLDDTYLSRIAGETAEVVAVEFDRNLWRIAYRMSGTTRLALVAALRRNPAVLMKLSPEAIGRLFRGVYMLPGESHLDLVGEWSLARPQPRCQAGAFPGWGDGTYQKLNTDFYFAIGNMIQGPYWKDVQKLIDEYLVRPSGECNLPIAYSLSYAARIESLVSGIDRRQELLDLFQRHVDDESLSGDARVTWLIAKTFALEVLFARKPPRLLRDQQYLQEAFLLADSDDYRFWALQEITARLASQGNTAAVSKTLSDFAEMFTSAAHQQVMSTWLEKSKELATEYAASKQAEEAASDAALAAELQRRLDKARSRNDQADIDRYQRFLEASTQQE